MANPTGIIQLAWSFVILHHCYLSNKSTSDCLVTTNSVWICTITFHSSNLFRNSKKFQKILQIQIFSLQIWVVKITLPPKHYNAERNNFCLGLFPLPILQNFRKNMGNIPTIMAIPPKRVMVRILAPNNSMIVLLPFFWWYISKNNNTVFKGWRWQIKQLTLWWAQGRTLSVCLLPS